MAADHTTRRQRARLPAATTHYITEQLEAAESEIDNARALPSFPVNRIAHLARAFHYLDAASASLVPWEVSK